jgi:hypothetical protein
VRRRSACHVALQHAVLTVVSLMQIDRRKGLNCARIAAA